METTTLKNHVDWLILPKPLVFGSRLGGDSTLMFLRSGGRCVWKFLLDKCFHLNASAGLTAVITYGVILIIMDSNRASLLELGAK